MRLLIWTNVSSFGHDELLFKEHLDLIMVEHDLPATLLLQCDNATASKFAAIISRKNLDFIHLGPQLTSIMDISLSLAIICPDEVFVEIDLFSLGDSKFLKNTTHALQLLKPALGELYSSVKEGRLKNVSKTIESLKKIHPDDQGTLSIYLTKYLRYLKRFSTWHSSCFIDDRQSDLDKDIFKFDERCFDSKNGLDIELPSLSKAVKINNQFYTEGINLYDNFRRYKKPYHYGRLLSWVAVIFRKKSLLHKNRNEYLLATSFLIRFLEEYVKAFLLINSLCELEGTKIPIKGKTVNGVGPYLHFLEHSRDIRFPEKELIFKNLFKALNHRNTSVLGHGYVDVGKESFDKVFRAISKFIDTMEIINEYKWYTKFNEIPLLLCGFDIECDLRALFDHNYNACVRCS